MVQSEVINVSNLDLTFETNDGPVHALKNVNLEINKGDFVSFIGPSGCGKTTLLRVLADLDEPTNGNVTVNGVSPRLARESRAYGYVFQAAGLYPWLSIFKNNARSHWISTLNVGIIKTFDMTWLIRQP